MSTAHQRLHPVSHLLFAHALSSLPEVHASNVQRHLEACRRCTQHMALITAEVAALCFALEPVPVPALIKESLLHSLSEIHRLYDLAQPVAKVLKLPVPEAHAILSGLDSATAWRQLHRFWVTDLPSVDGEPALIARVPGGVRLRPGLLSASPADGGAEVVMRQVLVLQGSGRDSQGQLWHPGAYRQLIRIDSLLAHPGADLIVLIVRALPERQSQAQPLGRTLGHHNHGAKEGQCLVSDV